METPDENEDYTEEIPQENTKEKRIKKALSEKQRQSNMNNLKRAHQINKDNTEIKQYKLEQEKTKKEIDRLAKLEEVRALKKASNPEIKKEIEKVEEVVKKPKKPSRIVEKIVYETESESSDEEIIERIVIKKKPREKSNQKLLNESSQEQLKKRLMDERKARVMLDLFDF
jgi:hypothetical protein